MSQNHVHEKWHFEFIVNEINQYLEECPSAIVWKPMVWWIFLVWEKRKSRNAENGDAEQKATEPSDIDYSCTIHLKWELSSRLGREAFCIAACSSSILWNVRGWKSDESGAVVVSFRSFQTCAQRPYATIFPTIVFLPRLILPSSNNCCIVIHFIKLLFALHCSLNFATPAKFIGIILPFLRKFSLIFHSSWLYREQFFSGASKQKKLSVTRNNRTAKLLVGWLPDKIF